jgi:hypothetical protein
VIIDWDATAIVDNSNTPVGRNRDVNSAAISGHCLVNRVVHHLGNEMVQTGWSR